MKAVIALTCWRGLVAEVPVSGSKVDRDIEMVAVPVPEGSNDGSPAGTGIGNDSRGDAVAVRLRS